MKLSFPAFLALAPLALALGCAPEVTGGGIATQEQPGPYVIGPGNEPGTCGDVELHVVGLYDPYSSATKTQGPAHVHIDRPGSVIVFLSAYSATDWTVTAGPDTDIVSVIANGYEPQSVTAPAGVDATATAAEQGGAFIGCGYEYPDTDAHSGCETPELLAGIESYVGIAVTSFHGCYAASDFTIGADLTSSSNCATDMGYKHTSMVSKACAEPSEPGGCEGKDGLGVYEGFFCEPGLGEDGTGHLITKDISCQDALANCQLNSDGNPGMNIHCTWNGAVIYEAARTQDACGPVKE